MFEIGLRYLSHCNIGGFLINIIHATAYSILPSIAGGLGFFIYRILRFNNRYCKKILLVVKKAGAPAPASIHSAYSIPRISRINLLPRIIQTCSIPICNNRLTHLFELRQIIYHTTSKEGTAIYNTRSAIKSFRVRLDSTMADIIF